MDAKIFTDGLRCTKSCNKGKLNKSNVQKPGQPFPERLEEDQRTKSMIREKGHDFWLFRKCQDFTFDAEAETTDCNRIKSQPEIFFWAKMKMT